MLLSLISIALHNARALSTLFATTNP